MNNLPDELRILVPPQNTQECFNTVEQIQFSQTLSSVDKFKLRLAKGYFCENLELFTPKQVYAIFKHPYFSSGYNGTFSKKAMKFSLKHRIVFPIFFEFWEQNVETYDKIQYVKILNENNNEEQLKKFLQKDENLIFNLLYENNHSYFFDRCIQDIAPQHVLYNRSWSKQEIYSWFESNQHHLVTILKKSAFDRTKTSKEAYEIFSDFLSSHFIENYDKKDETWNDFMYSLCKMPSSYWLMIEKKAPNILHEVFSKREKKDDKSISSYSINFAQSMLGRRNDTPDILSMMKPYRDIILEPIVENIIGYHKKTDPVEACVRNNLTSILAFYAFNMDYLNAEQKEMMVAASFNNLNKDNKTNWPKKVILESDSNILKKYLRIYIGHIEDLNLIKNIETIIKTKELEEKLPEKTDLKRKKL